jgi:hypoxanthine phosphoribosyltransferase
VHQDINKILFTEEEIREKVQELGEQITQDYQGKDLVLVNILRGGVIFLADLVREIKIPIVLDFMAITSYGAETELSGVVRVIKDLEENITKRHVLVVEDIIDTGLTLSYLLRNLKARKPASLVVCTLLDKAVRRIATNLPIRYKGFEVPDVFVVGYGLDFRQKYRNLRYIGILRPEIYQPQLES